MREISSGAGACLQHCSEVVEKLGLYGNENHLALTQEKLVGIGTASGLARILN